MPGYVLASASAALWLGVLWGSWTCVVLYSDGSMFLLNVVDRGGITNFDPPRSYAIGLMQVPLAVALRAGVTDLQWLSKIYSFGSLALPAALYQLALLRARNDGVLLGAVVAALATVYMTGFLFSVGEYSTAYAIAVAAMTFAVRRDPPTLADGLVLLVLAVLAMRTYQIFFVLGPVLAVPVAWRAYKVAPAASWATLLSRRPGVTLIVLMVLPVVLAGVASTGTYLLPSMAALFLAAALATTRRRPDLAMPINAFVHLVAAALFLAASTVSAGSAYAMGGPGLLNTIVGDSLDQWRNLPSDLTRLALILLFACAVLRPGSLRGPMPYVLAALPLLPLVLLPYAQMRAWPDQPLITLHYLPRLLDGGVISAIVLCAWLRTLDFARPLRAFAVLETPEVQRRGLALLVAMVLATMPANFYGAYEWREMLASLRGMMTSQGGTIDVFALPRPVYRFFWDSADRAFVGHLSRTLRAAPADALILPPGTNPNPIPELSRYWWRD